MAIMRHFCMAQCHTSSAVRGAANLAEDAQTKGAGRGFTRPTVQMRGNSLIEGLEVFVLKFGLGALLGSTRPLR